jgi:hypothetical protein
VGTNSVDLYCEQCGGEQSNFHKGVHGKLLFSTLYGMYMITLNEPKVTLKASAQCSGLVNKTSVESMAQNDDFQEVMTCKWHISPNIHSCQAAFSHFSELLTWKQRLLEQEATTNRDDFYHKSHSTPKRHKRPHQRTVQVRK